MNSAPDRRADGALGSRSTGEWIDLVETSHVFDGNFNAKIEALGFAGVNDCNWTIYGRDYRRLEFREGFVCRGWRHGFRLGLRPRTCFGAAEKSRYLFEGPLRSGKADARQRSSRKVLEPLQGKGQMRTAFGGNDGVDFIHDDGFHG